MKKILFSLAFIASMLTSCVNDKPTIGFFFDDKVSVTIGVAAPELTSRATLGGMNSGLGAIDNFGDEEWKSYDIRYILEVYDATQGFENYKTPVRQRVVETYDSYQEASFELRLIPDRTYRFVVWADLVEQGSKADLNYNTESLSDITRTDAAAAKVMDESMDAYFIAKDILIEDGRSHTLTLTRPFGKLRVITTDINDVNIGTTASKVNVTFYNHPVFVSLNAITGDAETTAETVTYSYAISKDAPYTEGYDADQGHQTLFADYIFAKHQVYGAQEVNFKMEVVDQNDRRIRSHDFNTQIPLERNKLTTLIGNMLVASTEFIVSVDDNFSGYYDINIDAKPLVAPDVKTSIEANKVTLRWEAVDGAAYYTVQLNDKVEQVNTNTYSFEGEYDTEYTFTVKAITADPMQNLDSDAVVVTVKTEAAPVVSQEVTATLTFDNKDKRTAFSTTQQIWTENDITVTNDKSASTTAVADYAKPVRFYAGSKITVAASGNIKSIIFDCNSSSYATALKNSIGGAAVASSDKVTVNLDGTATDFVVAKLTAQVRMDAVTVTYVE